MGVCCSDRRRPGPAVSSVVTCSGNFEQPVQPLGSSVNGVRFFRLVRVHAEALVNAEDIDREENGVISPESKFCQWLGKDYAQAFDELEFYNACYQLRDRQDGDTWRVFDFLPSFHGIIRHASCYVHGTSELRTRMTDLLVFRSPLEGLARPRLLNIEVGARTCALQHRRESEVATVMFARQEGIRVEGFMSPPHSILSEDPGIDTKGWSWGDASQRRAKRVALQSLRLSEVLTAFVDLRDAIREERLWPAEKLGQDAAKAFAEQFLGPAEYSELALLNVVKEVASLLRASIDVPVPQKWFGGSVGLLVEAGVAPPRKGAIDPEAWVAARVKIRLFGWSRSRVTDTLSGLHPDEQRDTEMMWQIYRESLCCLLWEASHLYFQSCCAEDWTDLTVQVYEFGAKGEVLLGAAELHLDSRALQSRALPLVNPSTGAPVFGQDDVQSKVSIATRFATCNAPSRFAGIWHVQVAAAHLPPSKAPALTNAQPLYAKPDVFAIVTLREQTSTGGRSSSQRTRMDPNRPHPQWREDFEFPVACPGGVGAERLSEALGGLGDAEGAASLAKHVLQPMTAASPSNTDSCRTAALCQMAFITEVMGSWSGLQPQQEEAPLDTGLPSSVAPEADST